MKNNVVLLILLLLAACSEKQKNKTVDIVPSEIILQQDIPVDADALIEESKKECPDGMKLVEGDYCPDLRFTCLKYEDEKEAKQKHIKPHVCAEFKNPGACYSKKYKHMKFCEDTYEFPNIKDQMPDVMLSYHDAEKLCKANGKRLCDDSEWTFSCEGISYKPYPYGFIRDSTACNIDNKYIPWDPIKIQKRDWNEVNKLDQRVPSGSMERCVSDFGIYDLTGNVDEAVNNDLNNYHPYKNALKGGHDIKNARNTCFNHTLIHNEDFFLYISSSRCCKNIE